MTNQKFWFVWNPQGCTPNKQHRTKAEARIEATRLAQEHRGQVFVVLESVGHAVVNNSEWVKHRGPDSPFYSSLEATLDE